MELSGPFDLVYDKNAARKKTDDRSSALPTTPVTWKRTDSALRSVQCFEIIMYNNSVKPKTSVFQG